MGCPIIVVFSGNIQYFWKFHKTNFMISSQSKKSEIKNQGDFWETFQMLYSDFFKTSGFFAILPENV